MGKDDPNHPIKKVVYKWMATRFPCKSQGWVIFHMLVEKAREKTQFGWFPVKKAVANTGSCGNCDLHMIHMPRAKTIHILEDLTQKTVQVNLPSQKRKVIWVLGVLSRLQPWFGIADAHKQHPWNVHYPRCGIRKISSPRQGDKGSRQVQSRLSSWWGPDGWAHSIFNHQGLEHFFVEDSPPLSEDEAWIGTVQNGICLTGSIPPQIPGKCFGWRRLIVGDAHGAVKELYPNKDPTCAPSVAHNTDPGQMQRSTSQTFHWMASEFRKPQRGNHQNQMRRTQLLWVKGELFRYIIL